MDIARMEQGFTGHSHTADQRAALQWNAVTKLGSPQMAVCRLHHKLWEF